MDISAADTRGLRRNHRSILVIPLFALRSVFPFTFPLCLIGNYISQDPLSIPRLLCPQAFRQGWPMKGGRVEGRKKGEASISSFYVSSDVSLQLLRLLCDPSF